MRLSVLIVSGILVLFTARAPHSFAQHPDHTDPRQKAAVAFDEGQNAQERGDMLSAVKFYTDAINAAPTMFQIYYQRATALIALSRESEAEADLKKVIELNADFARAHRALGQLLLDRGITDDALREFARAIELDPKLTGVRIYYASALIKNNQPAKAIEHLRAALEQNESPALAHALLGIAEERTGKPDDAFNDYSRAIEMDAGIAPAREGRARLFEAKGETAKAIEDYTIAYRAQPSPELARKLADLHARAGQAQAAIQLYRGLLLEKPDDLGVRAEMLRLMIENGQAEEATRELKKILAASPANAKLLTLAGDIYLADKPEEAAEYYRRAVELSPDDNRARVQLGAALTRSSQFEVALPVLADAISREENNYAAHANLATALFKLKRYPQAAAEFIWVLKQKPDIPASYFFLAISLDRIGDCEQAVRAYQAFTRIADPAANKEEIEEANIRLSLLEKLVKSGKCKSLVKGKQ